MIKQETFDTVVNHLRKQGCKALDGRRCRYRTPEGLMCAAGCLIPNEEYDASLEECGTVLMNNAVRAIIAKQGHDLGLVRDLQEVHDDFKIEDWEHRFKLLTIKHHLEYK